MIFDYIIYFLVSALSALASYYLTNNIYFLIGTFLIFVGYFIFYELKFRKKIRSEHERSRDLNIFIHDFFVSYSINKELRDAFEYASSHVSNSLKEQIKLLDEFNAQEKLSNLSEYFNSSLYQLFLKTVNLSFKNKNNIIKTASFLLEENNRLIIAKKMNNRDVLKSFCEFALLWVVAFLIILIMRFAINNYFVSVSSTWFYLVGIGVFFLFFLFSIHLFIFAIKGSVKKYEQ